MILLGLNEGTDSAEIHGKSVNPLIIKSDFRIGWWILTFVILMVGIAALIYLR